ncbi:DnaD domain-containing protein [[Bacillus] enclensis]|uniref:DnaD domain-containing protein n=1 Tax=[Bacillus] enclensis TaxID=1402860 RepID=UPI0018DC3194|nr:DnaD domain protein [[Bacillus] enclensis]MBH9967933.1 DnaD domain protein [[Bacillus] enclensis]
MKSGCKIVDQVGEMKIEGNLVPHLWYKNITFASGKAHFVAITLLADILYWYRPTLVRDESGDVVGTRTKFKGDMLQKSYQAFSDTYGFTKRQVKEAVDFLVENHLLIREFRTITTSSIVLSNVMYVQPVAGNVNKIMSGKCHVSGLVSICPDDTLECTGMDASEEGMSRQEEGAPPAGEGTYTERSSESSSERKNKQQQSARGCAVNFFTENGFGKMGAHIEEKIRGWCAKLSDSLVLQAMKKAVEQGKQYWSYVEAILKNWEREGVRDVKDAEEKEFMKMFQKVVKEKTVGMRKKPVRTEKLPEWFTDGESTEVEVQDDDFEAEKAKLVAELKAFTEGRDKGTGTPSHLLLRSDSCVGTRDLSPCP